jgi:hypothetical protein
VLGCALQLGEDRELVTRVVGLGMGDFEQHRAVGLDDQGAVRHNGRVYRSGGLDTPLRGYSTSGYADCMRFWLKEGERRPDPEPVKSDDRKAVLVGLVLWLLALAGLVLFLTPVLASGHGWWLWTGLCGLGLGLVLLVFAHRKQV